MRRGDGAVVLRQLIAEEIAQWGVDHKRGLRPHDLADPDRVADRAYRNLAGYGPLEPLLVDGDVWEIMVNGSVPGHPRRLPASDPRCPRERCSSVLAHLRETIAVMLDLP